MAALTAGQLLDGDTGESRLAAGYDSPVKRVRGKAVPPGGCAQGAERKLLGRDDLRSEAGVVSRINTESFSSSMSTSAVKTVFAKWSSCMKKAGYDFPDPLKSIGSADLNVPAAPKTETAARDRGREVQGVGGPRRRLEPRGDLHPARHDQEKDIGDGSTAHRQRDTTAQRDGDHQEARLTGRGYRLASAGGNVAGMNDRAPAPGGLALLQSLVNTLDIETGADALDTVEGRAGLGLAPSRGTSSRPSATAPGRARCARRGPAGRDGLAERRRVQLAELPPLRQVQDDIGAPYGLHGGVGVAQRREQLARVVHALRVVHRDLAALEVDLAGDVQRGGVADVVRVA
jgi:hypothetical protein